MTLPVWPPDIGAGGGGGGPWTGGSPTGPSPSQIAGELANLKSPSYAKPIPIVYGTAAVKALPLSATISVYDSEVAMNGTDKFTMPTVTFAGALSFGPVTSVDFIVYEKRKFAPSEFKYLSRIVGGSWLTPPEVFLGDGSTTTWSGSPAPNQWKDLAIFRCLFMGMPGGKSSTPVLKAVVRGKAGSHANTKRIGTGSWTMYDALPGDVIRDLLENSVYGLGLPAGTVVTATGADGSSASSYDTYCAACGWYIAMAIDTSVSVAEVVSQILTATNSVGFWSGSNFKIVPLGDTASGSYAPVLSSTGLTEDDLVSASGQDAIRVSRRAWADVFNVVPVEYSADTSLCDSELAIAEYMDAASVAQYGVRRSSSAVSLPCIRSKSHAIEISAILARQNSWHRAVFEFTVTARQGAALEPGDLVSLTHTAMGLSAKLARIERIETSPETGTYRVEAREWITGASVTVAYSTASPDGLGNTPTPALDPYALASTKNRVTYATTAPSSPTTGDQWYKKDEGNKLYVWSGSAWVQGPVGPDGATGPQGPAGSSGTDGTRGSRSFSYDCGNVAAPSLSSAQVYCNAGVYNGPGSPWPPVLNDQVTLYSTTYSTPWSKMYFYTGSAWAEATVYIDGNLLVSGTVGASKFVSNLALSTIFRTANYDGGTGTDTTVPTAGALLDGSSGATWAARFAPSGIRIGDQTLDSSWFWTHKVSHGLVNAGAATRSGGDFTSSFWESDGTNYRLVLGLPTFGSFATAQASWYSVPLGNTGLLVVGAIDKVWVYFYEVSNGTIWADPRSGLSGKYINVWATRA